MDHVPQGAAPAGEAGRLPSLRALARLCVAAGPRLENGRAWERVGRGWLGHARPLEKRQPNRAPVLVPFSPDALRKPPRTDCEISYLVPMDAVTSAAGVRAMLQRLAAVGEEEASAKRRALRAVRDAFVIREPAAATNRTRGEARRRRAQLPRVVEPTATDYVLDDMCHLVRERAAAPADGPASMQPLKCASYASILVEDRRESRARQTAAWK